MMVDEFAAAATAEVFLVMEHTMSGWVGDVLVLNTGDDTFVLDAVDVLAGVYA